MRSSFRKSMVWVAFVGQESIRWGNMLKRQIYFRTQTVYFNWDIYSTEICIFPLLFFSDTATEKAMAPHSSTLAWKIPWTEEPGGPQSMGSLRIRHDWATSLSFFTFMHWRRKWQPTPVFLPGESQGRGSLVGCLLWGHTELDTIEAT